MKSDIEANTHKLKARGLIPSMTKGKQRWRITYLSGETEKCMTSGKVKKRVKLGNIVKVEKKKVLVVLTGKPENRFTYRDKTGWYDVSSSYL
jgi:hypothetical protein